MATAVTVLFPWKETYNVQIGIIDAQHKNLVKIINDLHSAMVMGHGKDELGRILSNLISYTKAHFKTEEHFLESYGYPDYPSHKTQHDQLTKTVLDFQGKFLRNEVGLTVEVMNFLKDWLGKHILGSDKRYTPFLNSKGLH